MAYMHDCVALFLVVEESFDSKRGQPALLTFRPSETLQ